ncbi:hypothetical protein [Rhodopseudomonas sp. BR0G17]|uniref:hypothetical protein n=1 Tax=Rhodopseudomonas sp. BR0G17 TaxID=2269368 RepID=UPI0013E006C4|nr:hypothetical protein [Rhodopseudomonas sp. BR0G17]
MPNDKAPDDRPGDATKSGTREPWKKPGQSSQVDDQNPLDKPDLERWQESNTH